MQFISKNLTFKAEYLFHPLSQQDRRLAAQEARAVVANSNACFSQLLDINVISIPFATGHATGDKNMYENKIVLRCRPDFASMIFHEHAIERIHTEQKEPEEYLFCFMLSDKIEPVVTVVVIDSKKGKLLMITESQVEQLQVALTQFRIQFGLVGELYSYTSTEERTANALHSRHFHLRVRIPSVMYFKYFPAVQTLHRVKTSFDAFVKEWEPLTHNFSLHRFNTWHEVRQDILRDIYQQQLKGLTTRERQQVLDMKHAMGVST